MKKPLLGLPIVMGLFSVWAKPVAVWVSHPVKPGEHVLVSGGGWGAKATVEMDGRTIAPDRVSDTGIIFKLPKDADATERVPPVSDAGTGAKSFTIVGADGARSEKIWVNEPVVWWTLGDDFDRSSPGGTIRFFGRSLKGVEVKVSLKSATDTKVVPPGRDALCRVRPRPQEWTLAKTEDDDYSITAKIPADLPVGTYEVKLSVRSSTSTQDFDSVPRAWSIAAKRQIWKTEVFNVVDFGAIPDDGEDDTLAIRAAVRAAETNGGGIVQFPIGTVMMSEEIEVPPRTLLKGVSSDVSQIQWPDVLNADRKDFHVRGRSEWGIHDLMLSSGLYANGIGIRRPGGVWYFDDVQHDVSLKNLKLRFICDQWRDESTSETFLARYKPKGLPISMNSVTRLELDNVDIYSDRSKEVHYEFCDSRWMVVRNCRLHGCSGWSRWSGDRILFEDNRFEKNTQSVLPDTHRLVWKRNVNVDTWNGDCESLTTDLKYDVLNGQFARATFDGTEVTLDGIVIEKGFRDRTGTPCESWEKLWFRSGSKDPKRVWSHLPGMQLVAFDGTGAGQMRTIVAAKDIWHLTIDRPFDIPTDAGTRFSVQPPRVHHLYVDNVFEDGRCAVQLYGQQVDGIVARNRANRCGGFSACTIIGSGYRIPMWNIQFLDNTIVSSTNPHDNGMPRGMIGSTGDAGCREYTSARGLVVRRNTVGCNAWLGVGAKDMVAEGNRYTEGSLGLRHFKSFPETHYIDDMGSSVSRKRAPTGAVMPLWTVDPISGVARVRIEILREKALPVMFPRSGVTCRITVDGQEVVRLGDDRRTTPTWRFAKGVHEIVVTPAKPPAKPKPPFKIVPFGAEKGDFRFSE